MKKKLKAIAKKTLIATQLLPIVSIWQLKRTYLDPLGWSHSILAQKPINQRNTPLPWMNYTTIQILESRNLSKARVLEYGSGGSTHWWAQRTAFVLSIEHDPFWFKKCHEALPSNATLRLAEDSKDYPKIAKREDGPFDIVIIDAIHRNDCGYYAPQIASNCAVIIWDDSNRPEYQEGQNFLINKGFKQIRLFGVKPGASKPAATDIFYKQDNILGI